MDLTLLSDNLNSDKGTTLGVGGHAHRYTFIYESFFAQLRDKKLNILEIGIQKGPSLKMWEQYFPHATIVGIDINPVCEVLVFERSKVEIGDATDSDFLSKIIKKNFTGPIDIIIDDGSHVLEDQIKTLLILFPYLKEDGLYFVEDICASR